MKKNPFISLFGLFCLMLLLVGSRLAYSPALAASPIGKTQQLEVWGSEIGSASYIAAFAISEILNKKLPGIRTSSRGTSGSSARVKMSADRNPNEFLFIVPQDTFWTALAGGKPFDRKFDKLRWVAAMTRSFHFWMTFDKNIKTPADLVGKRVAMLEPTKMPICQSVIDAYGLKDKVKLSKMGFPDQAQALKDGLVDVIWSSFHEAKPGEFVAGEGYEELWVTRGKDLNFIGIDKAVVDKINQQTGFQYGLYEFQPGKLSANQSKSIGAVYQMTGGLVNVEGMDENLTYNIVKTLAENAGDFPTYSALLGEVSKENMYRGIPLRNETELHPGALKYYKEAGIAK